MVGKLGRFLLISYIFFVRYLTLSLAKGEEEIGGTRDVRREKLKNILTNRKLIY